ncbi:MAG: flagellar hook-basal body complex protein FliE [Oscillospiraceae bacterium]|nr:flagellar hook-basal body complex protein FliE [Oscillospiraceae bacterium]
MITPIDHVGAISSLRQSDALEQAQGQEAKGMFASVFQNAIDNVKETDADLVQGQYLLSTGQLDNPSTVMIAAIKNETAVSLLVQLRNKALDAYNEVTRISM